MKIYHHLLISCALFLASFSVQAVDFSAQKVTDKIYAYIGPTTDRTPENLGLNNNIGFIDTQAGWVLIDSGAGDASAQKLHKIATDIKDQPIVAVINIGSQDHRWLGNAYFANQGATIYAYKNTVNTQQKMFNQVLERVTAKVPALKGTTQKTADVVFLKPTTAFKMGGVSMQLNFYGDAHFPGDSVLWLPNEKVLFTGDMVYLDRMLGVHPWSNPVTWNKAYQTMRELPAEYIVPGHGQVSDWQQADAETGDYLNKLIENLTTDVDNFVGVGSAVKNNADWPEFKNLKHYESWHKRNLNRTYLKLESSM